MTYKPYIEGWILNNFTPKTTMKIQAHANRTLNDSLIILVRKEVREMITKSFNEFL